MCRKRVVIISVSLSTLLTTLSVSGVNILLPRLVTVFDTTFSVVQWVTIGYMIFMSSTLFIAGRLSDLVGRRKVYLFGILVFVISATLASVSDNIWLLLTSRALQGIGAGMLIAAGMALIADIASEGTLGSGMGLLASMSAVGTALGPLIGGYVGDTLTWRIIFLLNIPIGLIVCYLASKFFGHLDTVSNVSSCLEKNSFNDKGTASLKPSFIDLKSIKNAPLAVSLLSNALVPTIVMTTMVTGPFYLFYGLNQSISNSGLIMSIGSLIVAVCAPLVGKMTSKFNSRFFIMLGLFEIAVGTVLMSSLETLSGVLGYLLATSFMAIGYATFTTSNNTLIMRFPAAAERGAVSGLISLSKNIGLLSGASLMTMLFNHSLHGSSVSIASNLEIQLAINSTYRVALFLSIAVLVINLLPTIKIVFRKLNLNKLF